MAFDALLGWTLAARWRRLAERFLIVPAAGREVGESMAGIGLLFLQLLR